ncbi:MAG: glycosyltransferase family 2 protein [Deltaproteobacteria bacterium]|nr:glycosyltransferase family 2 protein [Deltaproteobacteria bacterium]
MWLQKLKNFLIFVPNEDMDFGPCTGFQVLAPEGGKNIQVIISVIVVNYNGRHLIGDCLDALRRQTCQNFEIIVVDNGSRDGSVPFIQERYPEVKVIVLPANYGYARAADVGIQEATGSLIFLLNNDASPEPLCLETLVKVMEANTEAGFCATRMVLSGRPELLDSAGDGFSVCGASFKRGHLESVEKFMADEWVFGACGGAALYRREMLAEVGLLDEAYYMVHEDSDLNIRAQMMNYPCLYAAGAVVAHRCNATLSTYSASYVYFTQRNVERLFFKNVPTRLLWRMAPRHILYNVLGFFYFLMRGKGLVFFQAKWHFLRGWKELMKSRKKLKSLKRIDDEALYGKFEKNWLMPRIRVKMFRKKSV